jgi:hypothetical protein
MPNYVAMQENNKAVVLGFFVCDMEADEYALNTLNLDKYSITEIPDYSDRKAIQTEQLNIVG